VFGTCYVPRPIVFEAHGSMSDYGSEWNLESPFENARFVMLRKGILMGDPLTKVILHLINILVRVTGANYASPAFIEKIFPMESGSITDYVQRYSVTDPSGAFAPSVVPLLEEASSSGAPVVKTDIGGYRDVPLPAGMRTEPVLRQVPNDSEISELYQGLTFSLERALYPNGKTPIRVSDDSKKKEILLPERDRFLKFENIQIAALLRTMELDREKKALDAERARQHEELRRKVASMRFNLGRPTQPVTPAVRAVPQSFRKGKRTTSRTANTALEEEGKTLTCFDLRFWA